jgi:hypothetical protein
MAFFKTAAVRVLGSYQLGDAASMTRSAALSKTASHFLQNAGSINVEAILADVADAYKISANPRDYIYIPVRANSVDVPNENGDAFSKDETLRFDHKIGRRVYQTYLLKPHHVNHRADNPRMARGVIVDVHYNDLNPMPSEWRKRYEASTGKSLDRDLFVEALLAVDTTKDPFLSNGMKAGSIDSFSMGCECASTRCSVCNNVATTRLEFCPHIRYGNKMKWYERPSDRRSVQAFEWCEGVVYSELSAVDQPADPRAVKGADLFQLHASRAIDEFSRRDLLEIAAFAKAHEQKLPRSLQRVIASILSS